MIHVDHVDKVEREQPEEESTDPAGELEELHGHGMVVLVLHLHLGKGHVDDGLEGELAGVGPATTEEEEGAKNSKDNAEVEPGVDEEEAAALAILWLLFSGRSSEAIFSVMVLSSLPVASFSFSSGPSLPVLKEISSVSVLAETPILLDSLSWFFLLLLMDWSSV